MGVTVQMRFTIEELILWDGNLVEGGQYILQRCVLNFVSTHYDVVLTAPSPSSEQEMDRKKQDHRQEMERVQQTAALGKQRLLHDAKLKKEASEVS